jgi:hypothetical protein
MSVRRFPWLLLMAAWLVIGIGLTIGFRDLVLTGYLADSDDYIRLQQVRDLMAGQSWFDLAQHRIHPPAGLPMHWSRLVDVPLLLFIVPLQPLFGAHAAEMAALVGAPLLTLLVLLLAVAAMVRRLIGFNVQTLLIGLLFAIMPLHVLMQIHPGRIDHHGWQIALAAAVIAALLDERPQRSGALAGVFTALFLTISVEGAPFAVAALGTVSLLWIFSKESGQRLVRFAQSLAVTSIVATAVFAPAVRWSELRCDAVMPGHLATLVTFALTATLAVRFSEGRGLAMRGAALMIASGLAVLAMWSVAPQCLADPYGTMDPLVRRIWFDSVQEGLPVWKQGGSGAIAAMAFPVIGLIGAVIAWRERRTRGWLVAVLLGFMTLLTGALVFRAAGIAQIAALPGAVILVETAMGWGARRKTMLARVVLQAVVVIAPSPLGPLVAAAAIIPETAVPQTKGAPVKCDINCAVRRLDQLPPTQLMNPIDLGPPIVAWTHHGVYVASYHRLQQPLADTIGFFMGSDANARTFMHAHGLRYIVFDSHAEEIGVYRKQAPTGFAAQLASNKTPFWLRRVDFGVGNSLLLFEVIQR